MFQLIAKWSKTAAYLTTVGTPAATGKAEALRECAKELAEALNHSSNQAMIMTHNDKPTAGWDWENVLYVAQGGDKVRLILRDRAEALTMQMENKEAAAKV